MEDNKYQTALAALQFFSMPAAHQIESARLGDTGRGPVFFDNKADQDTHSDYFNGIACVFKTYQGYLYDRLPSENGEDALTDFVNRLNVEMLNRRCASDWSERAVLQSDMWERLRHAAKKALGELREGLPKSIPRFDVQALINPSDFLPTEEARRLLDE